MNSFSCYLLPLLALLVSCKSTRHSAAGGQNTSDAVSGILASTYHIYAAKGKFSATGLGQALKANADIRLRKDSLLWVSLRSGTGIEGVRLIVTPDSLKAINRLEKKYYAHSLAELSEKINFRLSFGLIQAALVGDVPDNIKLHKKPKKTKKDFIFSGILKDYKAKLKMYVSRENKKLNRVEVFNGKKSSLYAAYRNFKIVNAQPIAHQTEWELHGLPQQNTPLNLQFNHKQIRFPEKPLRFRFKIPGRYTRSNIFNF